jgi:CheY-like chemotaxis protein
VESESRSRQLAGRSVWLAGGWVVVLLFGLAGFHLWSTYQDQLESGHVHSKHLAKMVNEHMEGIIERTSTLFDGVDEVLTLATNHNHSPFDPEIRSMLVRQQSRWAYLMDLLVLNSMGQIVHWTGPGTPPMVSDRDYARFHLDAGSSDLYIGYPLLSRVHVGQWFFAVSRARRDAGSVGHIVVAIFRAELLTDAYRTFMPTPDSAIFLADLDGRVHIRLPDFERFTGLRQQTLADLTARMVEGNNKVVSAQVISPFDEHERVISIARITGVPLVVGVSFRISDLLQEWYERLYWFVPGILFTTLLLLILLLVTLRGAQRECDLSQRAHEAVRARSNLVAMISHEIRAPLNVIVGMSELLLEGHLGSEQRGYVQLVARSGNSLVNLIDNIIDMAALEAGTLRLQLTSFSLRQLLNDMTLKLAPNCHGRNISFSSWIAPDLPDKVRGDEKRIAQLLGTIVEGVVRGTGEGAVKLSAGRALTGEVQITISGAGVAGLHGAFGPDREGKSIDLLVRAADDPGIAAAGRLIAEMGGRVWQEEGAEEPLIRLLLPLPEDDATLSSGQSLPENRVARPRSNHERLHLLLAEDAEDSQLLVTALLKESGCDLLIVNNGQEAVRIATSESFDLILMDMQMPVMDGFNATRRIRQLEDERGGRRTPIVALTAHTMSDDYDRIIAAGCDYYIGKPVHKDELLKLIARVASGEFSPVDPQG